MRGVIEAQALWAASAREAQEAAAQHKAPDANWPEGEGAQGIQGPEDEADPPNFREAVNRK